MTPNLGRDPGMEQENNKPDEDQSGENNVWAILMSVFVISVARGR